MEASIEPAGPMLALAPPTTTPIPEGFTLEFDAATRIDRVACTVRGGNPMVFLRLSTAALGYIEQWSNGVELGPALGPRRLARRVVTTGIAHPHPPQQTEVPRLSVVIPVHNRASELDTVLAMLSPLRCIVVDDGSDDPASIAEVAHAHRATLVRCEVSKGPSAARNRGLDAASSDIVAFVDSDVEIDSDTVSRLARHFADPLVGAVAPRIIAMDTIDDGALARYERARSPLDLGSRAARVAPRSTVSYVPTATLLVRRSIGSPMFDESLRTGEDVDLVWKMVEAGWAVRYDPSASAAHPARSGLVAFATQRFRYGQSAAPLAARHASAAAPIATSAFTAAAWGSLALGEPIGAIAALGSAIVLLRRKLSSISPTPLKDAAALAGGGSLRAGPSLMRQVFRTYGVAMVCGSLGSRRLRRLTLAAAVIPALLDWNDSTRTLDPARFVGLSILDDLSYGAGVIAGAIRARSIAAFVPVFTLGSSTRGQRADEGLASRT